MKFSQIIGHREEKAKLVAMVDSGNLPHALLLHGPSGIGKTMVARAFVQYLFCTDRKNGDSCGKCPGCLQSEALNNPDIHYIFPIVKKDQNDVSANFLDEWKEFLFKSPYMSLPDWLEIIDAGNSRPLIHVTESEEIIRGSFLSSYGKGYKVYVIWQPEKMNAEAANRLLKVIEEPFADTLFILISNNSGEILPTILSRLQGIDFKPLNSAEIKEYMISRGKAPEEASALASIAKGNMLKATSLLDGGGELAEFRKAFMDVMRGAYARKMTDLKAYADKFAGFGREKSLRLLDYFARMLRESFISNLKNERIESMTPEERVFVSRFGPFVNAANVEDLLKEIDRAGEDISRNANQKIVFFDLLIEFTRLIRTKGMSK